MDICIQIYIHSFFQIPFAFLQFFHLISLCILLYLLLVHHTPPSCSGHGSQWSFSNINNVISPPLPKTSSGSHCLTQKKSLQRSTQSCTACTTRCLYFSHCFPVLTCCPHRGRHVLAPGPSHLESLSGAYSSPQICMAYSLISFRTSLKCHLLVKSSLTTLFKIATHSLIPSPLPCFRLFFFFPHQQHAEVPRPGIEPTPQQWPKPQHWQSIGKTCLFLFFVLCVCVCVCVWFSITWVN